mgnify:CR=1 FL=1
MTKEDLLRRGEVKYDTSCPFYKLLFYDLLHSSLYDHYCTLEHQWDLLHGVPIDYAFCEYEDHKSCPRFLRQKEREMERCFYTFSAD